MNRVADQPQRVSRRSLMLALAFLGLLAFAALAARVWHGLGPLHFDQRVEARLPNVDATTKRWLTLLSDPGEPLGVVLESGALATLVWWRSRSARVASFCAVVPIVVSVVAELVLKPVIERRTTGSSGLHFPSGHSTGVTSVATAAWLTYVSVWRSRAARVIGGACLIAVVIGVGVSRVALHAHFATDVVGASLYGAAATLALAAVWLPSTVNSRWTTCDSLLRSRRAP